MLLMFRFLTAGINQDDSYGKQETHNKQSVKQSLTHVEKKKVYFRILMVRKACSAPLTLPLALMSPLDMH